MPLLHLISLKIAQREGLYHSTVNEDRTYVSQIERAVGNPSLFVLCKIGAILETDVIDLLAEQAK